MKRKAKQQKQVEEVAIPKGYYVGLQVVAGAEMRSQVWRAISEFYRVFSTVPFKFYAPVGHPVIGMLEHIGAIVEPMESIAEDELRMVFPCAPSGKPSDYYGRVAEANGQYKLAEGGYWRSA